MRTLTEGAPGDVKYRDQLYRTQIARIGTRTVRVAPFEVDGAIARFSLTSARAADSGSLFAGPPAGPTRTGWRRSPCVIGLCLPLALIRAIFILRRCRRCPQGRCPYILLSLGDAIN
jgi:hypothetical protein